MYNLKVMDLPLNERPEEKLFLYGAESLSNTELIALILRCGSKNENVLGLSSRVLETVDGLNGMLSAGIQDFLQINGIKKAKASRLIALCELTKRINSYRGTAEEIKITEPRIVANILMNEMQNLPQEVLKLIILNTKNVVISIKEVFKGSLNSSIVHPREIFSEALKKNAASIIICHNHPSGDPTPSKEDGNYASMKEKSII